MIEPVFDASSHQKALRRGNAFFVAMGDGALWRWDHETSAGKCVAEDLPAFLQRVAEDWAHDLDGDRTWNYLV